MRTDIQFTSDPPVARVRLAGELDLSTGPRLCDVFDCLAFRGCTHLEVDCDAVTFVDAYTLALFRRQQRRLREEGGDLRVVAASACFLLVSGVAQYDTLQPITDTTPHLTVLRTRRHLAAARLGRL